MTRDNIGWRGALAYGLGDAGNALSFGLTLLLLLPYYTESAGLSPAAAGTLLLLVRFYDAAIDPLAGRLIDRWPAGDHRARLRIWVVAGAAPLLLLNVAVFAVPAAWQPEAKLVYAYASYALLGTVYAFVSIAYGSLAAAATQHTASRTRLGAARTAMATLTMVSLALLVTPLMRELDPAEFQRRIGMLTWAALAAGLACYGVCVVSTREVVARRHACVGWSQTLDAWLGNAALRRVCAVAVLALLASACGTASTFYFVRYVLMDAQAYVALVLVNSGAALLGALVLATLAAARWGKVRAMQLGFAVAAVAHLAVASLTTSAAAWSVACLGLAAAGSTMALALLWALEADTVEYGEWKHGVRLEAGNYAAFALVRKFGLALGGAVPAYGLSMTAYVPNLPVQAEDVRIAIVMGLAALPAVGYGLAACCLVHYPLDEQLHARIVSEIGAARREA